MNVLFGRFEFLGLCGVDDVEPVAHILHIWDGDDEALGRAIHLLGGQGTLQMVLLVQQVENRYIFRKVNSCAHV